MKSTFICYGNVLGFVFFFKDYFQGLEFVDWFVVYAPKLCIIHKINDI